METFSIVVDVLRYGQVKSYGDSIYEYIVKSDMNEGDVKRFCTSFLKLGEHEVENINMFTGSCSFPFGLNSFFKFTRKDPGVWHYITCHPYTG